MRPSISQTRRSIFTNVFLLGWAILLFAAPSSFAQEHWKAGVSSVDITPTEPIWMAGYASRDHVAEGTLAKLHAKVLILEDANGNRACLITADLIGVGEQFSKLVCREIRARYQLQRHQVAICTSHTHTGPVVGNNLDSLHILQLDDAQQTKIRNYTNVVRSKILKAVHTAFHDMQSVTLSYGSGRSTFAVNRRNNTEKDVPNLRATNQLQGPVDHDVPVLAIRNPDNQLVSIVFGYACHATVLSSYRWSGDYPGFAQKELERLYPGCIALFWAGCGADQNPLPRRTETLATHYGRRLAHDVDAVLLTQRMTRINSSLQTKFSTINLEFSHIPERKELESDLKSKNRYVVARAKKFMRQLDAGKSIRKSYPYPIGFWKLGDQVQFLFLGGEVVVDYALRLKTELSGQRTWVAGYANDVMAYIPSRRVLQEGGYEGAGAMVYYGQPSAWKPNVERKIVDQVHALVTPEQK